MTGVKIPGKREKISTWRAAECKMKQHTCSPLFSQINGHFNVTRGETDVRNRQSKLRIINVTVTHTHIKNVSVTSHVDTILLRHTVILFTRHMLLHFLHSYYTLSTEGISPFLPKTKEPSVWVVYCVQGQTVLTVWADCVGRLWVSSTARPSICSSRFTATAVQREEDSDSDMELLPAGRYPQLPVRLMGRHDSPYKKF